MPDPNSPSQADNRPQQTSPNQTPPTSGTDAVIHVNPATAPKPTIPAPQQPVSQLSQPVPLSTTPAPADNRIVPPPKPQTTHAQATTTQPSSNEPQADLEVNDENSDTEDTPLWRKIAGFLVSWIIIPAALVYVVHNFIFQAWYVDGQSMEPTFQNGNYLIVSKFDVSWKKLTGQANNLKINRGDVVIFNPPDFPNDIYFIKRAIGLPGDRVVVKDGTVTVYNPTNPNGVIIDEPYVGGIKLEGDGSWDVPPGHIFVLGDNRKPQASQDSRYFGPIPMKRFIGTASLRLLPVYEFGSLQHPKYDSRLEQSTN